MDEVLDEVYDSEESQDLSVDEKIEALQAINKITDVILETEGLQSDEPLSTEEESYVLDRVSDLAFGSEGKATLDFDFEVSEDEIESSFIKLVTIKSSKKINSRRVISNPSVRG